MTPWAYVLAGYLLTAVGILVYLVSLNWRQRAVNAQREVLRRQQKDAAA